jgi:hypothetical protein
MLVHDHAHVGLCVLQHSNRVVELCGVRNKDRLSQQLGKTECLRVVQIWHQVFSMKDANDVIQDSLVDRETCIARRFDDLKDFGHWSGDIQGGDLRPGHHDILHLALGEFQHPFEHFDVVFPISGRDQRSKLPMACNVGRRSLGVLNMFVKNSGDLDSQSSGG